MYRSNPQPYRTNQTVPVPEAPPRLAAWPRGRVCGWGCDCGYRSEVRIQTKQTKKNGVLFKSGDMYRVHAHVDVLYCVNMNHPNEDFFYYYIVHDKRG